MKKKRINNLLRQFVDFYQRLKNYDLYVHHIKKVKKEDNMSNNMKKEMQIPSFMSKTGEKSVLTYKKFEGCMNPPIEDEEDYDEVEELEEIEDGYDEEYEDEEESGILSTPVNQLNISKTEHQEEKHMPIKYPTEHMTNIAKAMTKDELETIADNMPIELCFNRIGKEIQKAQNLARDMQRAIDIFHGNV